MKTKFRINRIFIISVFVFSLSVNLIAQNKKSIAVISIDTKGLEIDNAMMGSMVRLELEKTDLFEVLDKYDVADILKKNGIDANDCFGKTKLVKVGKLLEADNMLTGSAEKFGEKIILILRLIDVNTEKIEKTDVMEYLNQQSEIQIMVKISLNNLLGIENDQNLVDLLSNFNAPITSAKTTLKLNGPRMGIIWTTGKTALRMSAPEKEGGFNMYPVSSMFGYQYEVQYISSGDFQALIEFVGAINGLESGTVVPSLSFLNGFRFNKSGFELGLGPVFRFVKMAEGYWDENDDWHLTEEMLDGENYKIEEALDSRGETQLSTGLIIAIGKTFKSGYLNVPVNLYVSPHKDGTVVGISFGFNVAKRKKKK